MKCIFCREEHNFNKSVEHIIPESLGNKHTFLPINIVCDKCNNYFSREIEKPILAHESFRNIRAYYQIPSKKGKIPGLLGKVVGPDINMSLRLVDNKSLLFEAQNYSNQLIAQRYTEYVNQSRDLSTFVYNIDSEPSQKEMSRFLLKMAYEKYAYFLISSSSTRFEKLIHDDYFENTRKYVRYNVGIDNWPYHRRVIYPKDTQMKHPKNNTWVQAGIGNDLFITSRYETYFVFVFYGVEYVINIGGPSIKGYEEWLVQHSNISPLIERVGCKIVVDKKKVYKILGTQNPKLGFKFDEKYFEKIT